MESEAAVAVGRESAGGSRGGSCGRKSRGQQRQEGGAAVVGEKEKHEAVGGKAPGVGGVAVVGGKPA